MRRALVASDSHVAKDSRVLNQIEWLEQAGWVVDTLGRGEEAGSTGHHHRLDLRSLPIRLLANTLLPPRLRYRVLVGSMIPKSLHERAGGYDLVVLNEVELLPWFGDSGHMLTQPGGRVHLDLHEYAFSQRRGLVHRAFFRRYRRWLAGYIATDAYSSRSVVSDDIADLYVERLGISRPSVVRSCPRFVDLKPSSVAGDRIRMVHHGVAQRIRSPHLMIDALAHLDPRFELHLMLLGAPALIADLKRRAAPYGDRVQFHPPAAVRDVAMAINPYDLEIAFFPPLTENLHYALPNKVFEAVQGRLGLVVGESPAMARLVREHGNGLVVGGWTAEDLAAALQPLTAAEVEHFKDAADVAARTLNAGVESKRFFAAIDVPST